MKFWKFRVVYNFQNQIKHKVGKNMIKNVIFNISDILKMYENYIKLSFAAFVNSYSLQYRLHWTLSIRLHIMSTQNTQAYTILMESIGTLIYLIGVPNNFFDVIICTHIYRIICHLAHVFIRFSPPPTPICAPDISDQFWPIPTNSNLFRHIRLVGIGRVNLWRGGRLL